MQKYRLYRVEMARRAIARAKAERHVRAGRIFCSLRYTGEKLKLYTPDIVGSSIFLNTTQTG